jgi:hypothetical protein
MLSFQSHVIMVHIGGRMAETCHRDLLRYTLDDSNITEHGPKQFPVSGNMRLLIYYRLEN